MIRILIPIRSGSRPERRPVSHVHPRFISSSLSLKSYDNTTASFQCNSSRTTAAAVPQLSLRGDPPKTVKGGQTVLGART
eukprot:1013866-Amorphochlora_amoeboformis.AAC.1